MSVFGAYSGDTLLAGIGSFWGRTFKDHEMLKRMFQGVETVLSQIYLDLLSSFIRVSVSDFPVFDKHLWQFVDLDTSEASLDAATGYYAIALPNGLAEFKFMQNRVINPTVVYERGYDFDIDLPGRRILFYTDVFSTIPGGIPAYADSSGNEHIGLWVPDASVDTNALYEHIGVLFGRDGLSSVEYKALLKGAWRFFVLGPTLEYIESGMCVIAGLPVSEYDDDEILSINNPGSLGVEVVTQNTTYVFPFNTVLKSNIIVGYHLSVYESMTTAFTVTDYVEDPTWWEDAIIPAELAPTLSLLRRRSRDAWYAPVYGGPTESITGFSNATEIDWNSTYSVVPNDVLWLGESGSEEPYLITNVDGTTLQFIPQYFEDVTEGLRYSVGSYTNMTSRAPVAADGFTMRVGGIYYGDWDLVYGDWRSRNMAYSLWLYILKYHVFAVVYDSLGLPPDTDIGVLIEVLKEGKPSYTLPYVVSSAELSDTVAPAESWNVAVGAEVSDSVAFDDNRLVYGGGGSVTYDDPLHYYGGMDLEIQRKASGTPATSPASSEAAYSGQPSTFVTDIHTISSTLPYTISDGVISDSGIFEGWVIDNSSHISVFGDVSGSHVNFNHGATSATDFYNGTRTAPLVYWQCDGPLVAEIKLDVSDLDSVASTAMYVFIRASDSEQHWAGARITFNGSNECIVEAIDTVSNISSSLANTNLGTGVTTMWIRLTRDYNSYDDFKVETKEGDGDPYTVVDTLTNATIGPSTEFGFALASATGAAVAVDVVDLETVLQIA